MATQMREVDYIDLFSVDELNGSRSISFLKIEECIERLDIRLIVVDFDGTLCQSNSMIAQLIEVKSLAKYLKLVRSLLIGKAEFKTELSAFVPALPGKLKLRIELLAWLVEMQKKNLEVIIATASESSFVSNHLIGLGWYFPVFGSTKFKNLKGAVKAQSIRKNYPTEKYVYFGDSKHDIPVWTWSSLPILVGANSMKSRYINKVFIDLPRLDLTK
jgi:phosphoserine phosphatase